MFAVNTAVDAPYLTNYNRYQDSNRIAEEEPNVRPEVTDPSSRHKSTCATAKVKYASNLYEEP